MDRKVYEAVKTVKEFCESFRGCEGCPAEVLADHRDAEVVKE